MEESNHFKKHNASNFTSILIMKYQQLYVALFGQNMLFKLVISDQANNRQIYWGTYDHQGCQDSENVENLFDSLIKQKAVAQIEENKLNVMIETEEKLIEVCKIDLKREKSNKIKTGLSLFSKKKKNEQKYRIALEKLEAIPPRSSLNWVSRSCEHYDRLILKENKIKINCSYFEELLYYLPLAQIYGSTILTGIFKYKIKKEHFLDKREYLCFGISDIKNMNLGDGVYKSNHYILFCNFRTETNDLTVFPRKYIDDFTEISIIGSINDGIICIERYEYTIASFYCPEMKNKNIKWVPMLSCAMYEEISILETFSSHMLLEFFLARFWFEWDDDIMHQINEILILFEINDEIEITNINNNYL